MTICCTTFASNVSLSLYCHYLTIHHFIPSHSLHILAKSFLTKLITMVTLAERDSSLPTLRRFSRPITRQDQSLKRRSSSWIRQRLMCTTPSVHTAAQSKSQACRRQRSSSHTEYPRHPSRPVVYSHPYSSAVIIQPEHQHHQPVLTHRCPPRGVQDFTTVPPPLPLLPQPCTFLGPLTSHPHPTVFASAPALHAPCIATTALAPTKPGKAPSWPTYRSCLSAQLTAHVEEVVERLQLPLAAREVFATQIREQVERMADVLDLPIGVLGRLMCL